MLLIMVTLKIAANVDEKYLVTAIALVQTAWNLGTILSAGDIIDKSGYEMMSFSSWWMIVALF